MDSATITAVIPTFRRPAMLRRSIESVLAQTYPHVRVAVFDNASGDETASVVAELAARDPRVHYRCHATNLGAVRNFQSGIDAVETPFFSLLSDDDLLLPGFYERAISCLERQPRARLFCGQTVRYNPDDGSHEARPTRDWHDGFYEAGKATLAMIRTMFTWTGVVFSSEVRERAGPLEEIKISDPIFMARAAAHFPLVVSLTPCAVRTYWEGSALRNTTADQLVEAYKVTTERLAALPTLSRDDATRVTALLETRLNRSLGVRFRSAFLAGNWQAVERIGELLGSRDALTFGRRQRLALVRNGRGGLLARGARGVMRIQESLRRRARRPSRPATLEEVVRLYSARLAS